MDLKKERCVPCSGGVPPMTEEEEQKYMNEVSGWTLDREGEHKIKKIFEFDDFKESMNFVNQVADIANKENHHPNICINYNKVNIDLFTHKIGGLHQNDFIMASKIDDL